MTLKIGDKIPSSILFEMGKEGPGQITTEDLFGGKTIILFGLPGAFTPTCSEQHLPGYILLYDQLLNKGIDEIVCFSVNDAFVMGAWGKSQEMKDHKVRMIGDGSGLLTQKMGLELDRIEGGMGMRCQRFAMVVKDGIVKSLDIDAPGELEVSSAAAQLVKL